MLAVKGEGKGNQALRTLLKGLLEKGAVQAVLVPSEVTSGESYAHILTRDPSMVDETQPVPPVMPVQGGRVVSKLSKRGPVKMPTAVVLRPCELRAARELIKLNQVKPEDLLTISFDCPGAYPLSQYINGDKSLMKANLEEGFSHLTLSGTRPLCQICNRFTGDMADIEVGFLEAPDDGHFLIAHTLQGEEALRTLGYQEEIDLKEREETIQEMVKERTEARENYFQKEFGPQVSGPQGLLATLHSCINCHNCMRVCPICFCRECFFDSDALKVTSENYLMRAERKGALRFLPDTLLFHLGRMNHMSTSCVSCGTCEDACPNDVPVSRLFAMVADKTQSIFDYVPGRDLKEPIPLIDYREEELQEWERPYTESTTHYPSSS